MTDTPRRTEVAEYEAAVRRHLADLPAATREDLLADLDTHLAEIAAELEPGASLVDRLGVPEAYAAELREAAEIPPAPPAKARSMRSLADGYTASAGVGEFKPFWKSLRPGWWVLRGVLLAGLASTAGYWLLIQLNLPVPEGFYEFWLVAVPGFAILALVCVWLSLRVGVRSRESGGPWRVIAGGATAAVFLGLLVMAAAFAENSGVYYPSGSYDEGWVDDSYIESPSEFDSWEATAYPDESPSPEEDTPTDEPTSESYEPTDGPTR